MPTTPFGPVRVDRAAGLSAERRLYLVLGDGTALRYTVAVGRPGKQWQGWAQVNGKHVQPAWTPPAEGRADNPRLPEVIPGGAPNNPMGVAAMTLPGAEDNLLCRIR